MECRIKKFLTEEQIKKYYPNIYEDSSIKAEYVIYDELDGIYENISEFEGYMKVKKIKSYNYGDLVATSTYRDTGTYFVGKNGKLIPNPDSCGSGYLTIPIEITQKLDNATEKYKDIEYNDIELKFNDKLLKDKIGDIDSQWGFKYSYIPMEEELYVEFPNRKGKSFDINNTKPTDIYNSYLGSMKQQSKLTLKYSFKDNKYDEFKNKYSGCRIPIIPITWNVEHGSCGGGHKYSHGTYYFSGPSENLVEVMNSINEFYHGFDYTLT